MTKDITKVFIEELDIIWIRKSISEGILTLSLFREIVKLKLRTTKKTLPGETESLDRCG